MIKKISIIFLFFIIIVVVLLSTSSFEQQIVVKQYNHTKQPIKITPNRYKDRFCNMSIEDIRYSAQAVLPNKNTLFFDDIGCLILWLKGQKIASEVVLWVWARDKNGYIDARKAWYSLTESTPMKYGFGAYETKQNSYIDFYRVKKRMEEGKTMANPKTRRKLLGNN